MTESKEPLSHRSVYTLFAAGAVVLILLALLIVSPMLLSTPTGTHLLVDLINKRIEGNIQIGNLYLDWFSGIKVKSIKLLNHHQETIFTIDEVSTTKGLWHWLWGRGNLGTISIIEPSLTLKLDKEGTSSLDATLGRAKTRRQRNKALQNPWAHHLPIIEVEIYQGKMTVDQEGAPTAHLERLNFHLRHFEKKAPIHLDVSARSRLENLEGELLLDFSFDDAQGTLIGKADLHHFALALLDQLLTWNAPEWRGFLIAGLGPTLDLKFSCEGGVEEGQCSLKVDSANFKTSILASAKSRTLFLSEPASVLFILQPTVWNYLGKVNHIFESIPLREAANVKVEIANFQALEFRDLLFNVTTSVSPLKIGALPIARLEARMVAQDPVSPIKALLNLTSAQGTLEAKGTFSPYPQFSPSLTDLVISDLPLSLVQNLFEIAQPLTPILGDKLSLEIHQEKETLNVAATTPLLQLPMTTFKIGKNLELQSSTRVTYLLTPSLIPSLLSPSLTTLNIETLTLPLPQWPLDNTPWRALATSSNFFIEKISLAPSAYTPEMELAQVRFAIDTDHLPKGKFVGSFLAHLPQAKGIGASLGKEGFPLQVQGNYHLTKNFKLALDELVAFMETRYLEMRLSAALKDDGRLLMTAPLLFRLVIDPQWLTTIDPELASLVLQPFSFEFEGSPSELNLEKLTLDTLVAQGRLHISPIHLGGEIEATIEELKGNASLNLPKEIFKAALNGKTKMRDGREGRIKVNLGADQFLDLSKASLQSELICDVLPSASLALFTGKRAFLRLFGPDLTMHLASQFESLKPLQGHVNTHLSSKSLNLDAFLRFSDHSTFKITGALGEKGKLSFFGEGEELIGAKRSYTAKGEFETLPIPLLTQMLPLEEEVRAQVGALLGNEASGNLGIDFQGARGVLELKLESDHTNFSCEGVITPSNFTLTAPLNASIHLTPEIGQLVIGHLNPFFIYALRSEAPVTLEVKSEGFSFPLPYQEHHLEVGAATLNLGKLWLKNRGEVGTLLTVLKHSPLNSEQELQTWCTPLYFSVSHGIVHCQRMDTLIGTSLQVASWGRVNLPQNKVRMTLGVGAASLRKLLGFKEIPDSYYLLLPVRGAVNDPYVDSKQATLAIAALLARKEGAAGKIFGGVLDLVSGNLLKQKEIPPPTTQPFPWNTSK